MRLSDFDYDLPEKLIANQPCESREGSRMLIVSREANGFRDGWFRDFPTLLRPGDVLVLNNTKVFPARLLGRSETGADVELLLVNQLSEKVWEALARPLRRLKPGKRITFGTELNGTIVRHIAEGRVEIEFDFEGSFEELLLRVGRTPLPPYIKREKDSADDDRERYQTVYARSTGAVAAPTAGLHFTGSILGQIKEQGVHIAEITLHVGYGTFEPVRVDDLSRHSVLPERYRIDEDAAETLNAARRDRRRIVAVGTTTTRTLENALAEYGDFKSGTGTAALTITPGYKFKAVDALLTNFHLPSSSLLILVSTFGGHELIMSSYSHAVASGYRFYSYGDCMFIE
jgi:S-adenosylmethionine:tRNA ribosyltransferase-isomerase